MFQLDITHKNLGLYYSSEDVDVSKLIVVKTADILHDRFGIEVGILAASHYVKFTRANLKHTEVFSCVPFKDGGEYFTIDELKNTTVKKEQALFYHVYSFESEVVDLEVNEYRYVGFLSSKELVLKHEFNSIIQSKFRPYTAIKCITADNRIDIETMHVYPEENIVVFTKSKICESWSI